MKRALLLLAVALSVVLATSSPSSAGTAGTAYVTPWIELELDTIASHRLNPPRASRALAREVGLALGRRIGRVAVRAYGDG